MAVLAAGNLPRYRWKRPLHWQSGGGWIRGLRARWVDAWPDLASFRSAPGPPEPWRRPKAPLQAASVMLPHRRREPLSVKSPVGVCHIDNRSSILDPQRCSWDARSGCSMRLFDACGCSHSFGSPHDVCAGVVHGRPVEVPDDRLLVVLRLVDRRRAEQEVGDVVHTATL